VSYRPNSENLQRWTFINKLQIKYSRSNFKLYFIGIEKCLCIIHLTKPISFNAEEEDEKEGKRNLEGLYCNYIFYESECKCPYKLC